MAASKRAAKARGKSPAPAKKKTAAKSKSAAKSKAATSTHAKKAKTMAKPATGNGKVGIRVRMYRVGFGDFFLLTVPGKDGPAHILIDCGVHAANIGTMAECVEDLIKVTGKKLALVILTHKHADHMSGFASNFDDFAEFDVSMVWITNRLDPDDGDAVKFMAQLTSVATQLQLRLGARGDEDTQAAKKAGNALGIELGVDKKAGGGGSNNKALKLLVSGFKSKPPVRYYQGGDKPELPEELDGAITAEILAPSPKGSDGNFNASDNRTEQYLALAGEHGLPDDETAEVFDARWHTSVESYPEMTFHEFDSGLASGSRRPHADGATVMEHRLQDMQPDVLAAAADKLDGTLNNQSLVVLFTCEGKKLLFVGDAQWGNWAYWLYGKKVTGEDPGITQRAREILGSIDFYKVGHHGSTNATPIPVVQALNASCAAMCCTATGAYGCVDRKTEVPRIALVEALETRTANRMVRSDWVAAGESEPDDEAREQLAELPDGFSSPGKLYIDYEL